MKSPDDAIRPIKIFGAVLIVFAVGGALFFIPFFLSETSPLSIFGSRPRPYFHLYFWAGSVVFYFLTGVGVMRLTKWGYFLFKLFLYVFFVAFPIGTIISYITLSYMRKHQIKRHFGFLEPSPG